jgi:hypothetical protein
LTFNEHDYTENAMMKQLALVELHTKDGSAVEAGCTCIESKHSLIIEGLSEEMKGFAVSAEEKKVYEEIGEWARNFRKKIETEDWKPKREPGVPKKHFVHLNPHGRLYLPHGLTECEKAHPAVQHKLAHCINEIEEKEGCRPPYEGCAVNPVAVCRASIPCP